MYDLITGGLTLGDGRYFVDQTRRTDALAAKQNAKQVEKAKPIEEQRARIVAMIAKASAAGLDSDLSSLGDVTGDYDSRAIYRQYQADHAQANDSAASDEAKIQ